MISPFPPGGGTDLLARFALENKKKVQGFDEAAWSRMRGAGDGAGGGDEARQGDGQEAARHDKVALGEVDGSRGVQHQHETQRHQRIGGAERHAVDQQLRQDHWPATASYRLATAGMRLEPS